MVIGENQIFNLMDTNGRRSDVLNALKIYLDCLEDLSNEYPTERWNRYPVSLAQFLFYQKALEKSPGTFRRHGLYDHFMKELGADQNLFLRKDPDWVTRKLPQFQRKLDQDIEKRARHYTSTLVKMGFTRADRTITPAGYSYLQGKIQPDPVEAILPLDAINLSLLRQLLKLKVFSQARPDGSRQFYAPFRMALYLLLNGPLDRQTFEVVVQGLSPYSSEALRQAVLNGASAAQLEAMIQRRDIQIPPELTREEILSFPHFQLYFKSSKRSQSTVGTYYAFYTALHDFRQMPTPACYQNLLTCLEENGDLLQKAFGYGKAVFQIGNRGNRYDLDTFLQKNRTHPLLTTDHYNRAIYLTYASSKWIDGIREYSDTTVRLLSATGLFKFETLPELAFEDILARVFHADDLRKSIFGVMSEEDYFHYEGAEDCYFGQCHSLLHILDYSEQRIHQVVDDLQQFLCVDNSSQAKNLLKRRKARQFLDHIRTKYPKPQLMSLLSLFSDRSNDAKIKKAVNDAATVPTIYEYIVGIAWFYLSGEDFDLYSSLRLTLNADFEPVFHASGGEGDIVIQYDDITVMLEVTLMNKQAQKRGEWEPVLRHSLNLKADNAPKETFTFFIADELDHNTINIWRAVASVPLESTNTHQKVSGVVIMPFTNAELQQFLQKGTTRQQIIQATRDSFQSIPQLTDTQWHQEILSALLD